MNFTIFIFFFATAFISAAEVSYNRRRSLEKSLLEILQDYYTGGGMALTLPETESMNREVAKDSAEADKKQINDGDEALAIDADKQLVISKLSFDVQQCILSFLNIYDLLAIRLVNHQYRKLSDIANQRKISQYNPKFVLKENWMNLALSKFLFKYFKEGKINTDELLSASENIISELSNSENYTVSLYLLSFIYEYENGVNSSLPLFPSEVYNEALAKLAYYDLPRAKTTVALMSFSFVSMCLNLSSDEIELRNNFIKETLEFIKTGSKSEEDIRAHFNFDPNLPLRNSRLMLLPPFFRVAMFSFILPLCDDEERFIEAIEIARLSSVFSQILLDQLNLKYPHLVDNLFNQTLPFYPAAYRAKLRKYPRNDIVGLEYLLSRNTANPFYLEELLAMSPDIPRLMGAFLPCNTMSLTEMDMIVQMKEAGLFEGIQNKKLHKKIESIVSGEIRIKESCDYAYLLQTQINFHL